MERKPTISVVIPTRNRPALTARAIASALAQTLPPHEVIVVDDASDDDTVDHIRRCHAGVRIHRHDRRKGGATARNTGIDAASGDLVAFLDSDDEWEPNKIERQVAAVLGTGGPGLPVVCFTALRRMGKKGGSFTPDRGPLPGEALTDYLFTGARQRAIPTSSIMVPRWLAAQVRFTDGLPCAQDADLCLRLAAVGAQFVHVAEPLTVFHTDVSDGRERITNVALPSDIIDWYRSIRSDWSLRTKVGFEKNVILPRLLRHRQRKRLALMIVFRALWCRLMGVNQAFHSLAAIIRSARS